MDKKLLRIRIPDDIAKWLSAQSTLNGSSMNSEIIRAMRERMNRTEKEAPLAS